MPAPPEPHDPPTATWTVRAGADLGRAIGEVRAEQGLTQAQVADAVGISRGYLAQLETGKSGRLLELLVRVLRRLGAEITVTFPTGDAARSASLRLRGTGLENVTNAGHRVQAAYRRAD